MPPRPGIEADDLVTPKQAAAILGEDVNLVRVWIHRHGIEPLGRLGRWNAYDFRDIAAVHALHRHQRSAA